MPDSVRDLRYELMRVGLLGAINTDGVVPDYVVRSWRRSISGSVPGDEPASRYTDVDTDSLLCRVASPILDRWHAHLANTGATLLLSDRAGSIVMRRASDSSVRRRLDRVHAVEGFDYSEDSVGTNGLGTSIAEKNAVYIAGSQHFNDLLAGLTCAAAPVATPNGSVIGSVSLSATNANASPLMLTLTREIGQQIEERLRRSARPEDLALAMSFMRYTNSQRPTVVMDQESMLANTPGLPFVDVGTHVMLWEWLSAHDWTKGPVAGLTLPSDTRVCARRVLDGPQTHYVLHFDVLEQRGRLPLPARPSPTASGASGRANVTSPAAAVTVVVGPPGSGRATLAVGRTFGDTLATFAAKPDAPWAQWRQRLAKGEHVLVRDVDATDDVGISQLELLVREHVEAFAAGRRSNGLALTACLTGASPALRALIESIGIHTETHPLAETPERIPGLVKQILDGVDPQRRHTLSPAALQALIQWHWPGNIAELAEVLASLVREVPTSVIQRRHLPPRMQQASPGRQLSMLETAERETIIKALAAAGGNRARAADLLGIGRTTLWRRLKYFNLDGDESSL